MRYKNPTSLPYNTGTLSLGVLRHAEEMTQKQSIKSSIFLKKMYSAIGCNLHTELPTFTTGSCKIQNPVSLQRQIYVHASADFLNKDPEFQFCGRFSYFLRDPNCIFFVYFIKLGISKPTAIDSLTTLLNVPIKSSKEVKKLLIMSRNLLHQTCNDYTISFQQQTTCPDNQIPLIESSRNFFYVMIKTRSKINENKKKKTGQGKILYRWIVVNGIGVADFERN